MLVLGTLRSMKQTQSLSSQSFGLCQEFLVILRAPSIYGQLQCLPDLWLLIYTSLLNIYTMMHLKLNMYKAIPGFRYPHLPKPMSIELVMPSNHLILFRPLLLLPSVFLSIRVFSKESALRIRWPKY